MSKKAITLLYYSLTISILAAQNNSMAIGRVNYVQQVTLQANNEGNGNTALFFNAQQSLYIHYGAPREGITTSNDEFYSIHIDGDPEGFPIFKLHGARKVFSKVPCVLSRDHCIIEDTLGSIDWEIHSNERRLFGSIECVKATGEFGGRQYEAWFSYEIPIPSGPFKLGGLPGLILEARSLDDKVRFLFSSIEFKPVFSEIIRMPLSGKRINLNYQEFIHACDQYVENAVKELKAQGHNPDIRPIRDTIELYIEN